MVNKIYAAFFVMILAGCAHEAKQSVAPAANALQPARSGYLPVNGIKMYYEIYGAGKPLVLLHGGGSSIHVSFGKGIQELAKHHMVIAVDEQGHGRTEDFDRPLSFENTADDIAELLKQLKVDHADFIGFSNGATTGLYLAIRHPGLIDRMIAGSGLYSREGVPAPFWAMMKKATLKDMPQELQDAYVKVAPHPENLQKMQDKDANRMRTFKDIPEKSIKAIRIPVLVMMTDHDVPTLEHGVRLTRLLPKGRFAVIPGSHDNFIGDVSQTTPRKTEASLTIMEEFLDSQE